MNLVVYPSFKLEECVVDEVMFLADSLELLGDVVQIVGRIVLLAFDI